MAWLVFGGALKYEIAKLRDAHLDAAVAKALGFSWKIGPALNIQQGGRQLTRDVCTVDDGAGIFMRRFSPSTSWADAGPILENHWNHCIDGLEDWLGLDWMTHIDSTQHSFQRVMMQAFLVWKSGLEREVDL